MYVEQVVEELYSTIRDNLFQEPMPACSVSIRKMTRSISGWGYIYNNGMYFIYVSLDALKQSEEDVLHNMIHQMVHIYCDSHGISNTCRGKQWHNQNFKMYAERFGLICSLKKNRGWETIGITQPSIRIIDFDHLCERLQDAMKKDGSRIVFGDEQTKFQCPLCKRVATSGYTMRLWCGWCMVEMERKEKRKRKKNYEQHNEKDNKSENT